MTPDDPDSAAARLMADARPELVDVVALSAAIPDLPDRTILTSGAPLPWSAYRGGQRRALIGAALFEGYARDAAEAEQGFATGAIRVAACHDHGVVGSVTGVTSASMPVLVVEDRASGARGHCTVYEGAQRRRLTYGVYDESVADNLATIRDIVAPALGAAIRAAGGVAIAPLIRRALGMGDELHSRNTAATLLLTRELSGPLFALAAGTDPAGARRALEFLHASDLFFLHVAMAAAKATADAAAGVTGSGVVTAMAVSEREFAIRVSGSGPHWYRAPVSPLHAKLFAGYSAADLAFMGGESMIMEAIGLGGLAAAAAPSLQDYSGGSPEEMLATTRRMYEICVRRHPLYAIPALGFEGTPLGIDVRRVAATGITPAIHMGAAHRDGGHIGAGILQAPIEPFVEAAAGLGTGSTALWGAQA